MCNITNLSIFDLDVGLQALDTSVSEIPAGSSLTSDTKAKKSLKDFGEKIGGARKDLFSKTGLIMADIAGFNAMEMAKYVTKPNVWPKPDYWKMLEEGMNPLVVAYKKQIRDGFPSVQAGRTVEELDNYLRLATEVKELLGKLESVNDCKKNRCWLEDRGFIRRVDMFIVSPVEGYESIITNRFFSSFRYDEYKIRKIAADLMDRAKAKKESKGSLRKASTKRQSLVVEQLKHLHSEGYDYRHGRHVSTEDILALGLRAGEFGEWLSEKERQENLDRFYDSIHNLAIALDVDVSTIANPGVNTHNALAIAFGSRGRSGAVAHFEPERHVINLTKMKGAGSLAHEFGHYLDRCIYLIENDQDILSTAVSLLMSDFRTIFPEFNALINSFKICPHVPTMERCYEIRTEMRDKLIKYGTALYEPTEEVPRKEDITKMVDEYLDYCDEHYEEYTTECVDKSEGFRRLEHQHSSFRLCYTMTVPLRASYSRMRKGVDEYAKDSSYRIEELSHYYEDSREIDRAFHTSKPYWATKPELFARAFAIYVQDKLAKVGIVDDYLTGHAESCSSAIDGKIRHPYPVGEEREYIDRAFDKFIGVLKSQGYFTKK